MDSQRSSTKLIVFDGYQTAPPLSRLRRLWQKVMKATAPDAWISRLAKLACGTSEPVIQRRHDRQGYPYYQVYDPVSRQHYLFTTESEVRSWLERRYYH